MVSPGADPHEGDGCTGEENRHEEEGLPAPDVWQSTDQRSWQKRQEALDGYRGRKTLVKEH